MGSEISNEALAIRAEKTAEDLSGKDWVQATFAAKHLLFECARRLRAADVAIGSWPEFVEGLYAVAGAAHFQDGEWGYQTEATSYGAFASKAEAVADYVRRKTTGKWVDEPPCPRCGGDGVDRTEVDNDGRLTGCACEECEAGRALAERYEAEAEG